jgi:hypothetical protein
MILPGCHIETLSKPEEYTDRQLDLACRVAAALNRGLLVIVERPQREQ